MHNESSQQNKSQKKERRMHTDAQRKGTYHLEDVGCERKGDYGVPAQCNSFLRNFRTPGNILALTFSNQ